jgi:hypothetical protein
MHILTVKEFNIFLSGRYEFNVFLGLMVLNDTCYYKVAITTTSRKFHEEASFGGM